VQQLAVGDLQLLRALGDLPLDFGVAASQLPVAIEGQAGEEQRDSQPGKGMGIEFTAMGQEARARLNRLMKTLTRI
jgi:hypothetical protein